MADDEILLMVLPESGAVLLVWPDGRAVRVARDGTTAPQLAALTALGSVDTVATIRVGRVSGPRRRRCRRIAARPRTGLIAVRTVGMPYGHAIVEILKQ